MSLRLRLIVAFFFLSVVPLAAVLDWARPQGLPVVVVPGGEHFFHGRLNLLADIVIRHFRN